MGDPASPEQGRRDMAGFLDRGYACPAAGRDGGVSSRVVFAKQVCRQDLLTHNPGKPTCASSDRLAAPGSCARPNMVAEN
jgi:hypothetical protein